MPGLNQNVALHHLAVNKNVKPVQQTKRKYNPSLESQMSAEIEKLKEVKFIREVQYPTWLANIVPVKKKNGQIRICVDFRDLIRLVPRIHFLYPFLISFWIMW